MIRSIRGTVTEMTDEYVVIETGGLGYKIAMPKGTLPAPQESVCIHTHLAVRENAMDLYGFISEDELAMFELLLGLPKIGPKSALQILSQADINLLQSAVIKQDPAYLAKMSGMSKKTAEKIVLELKDKLHAFDAGASRTGMHTGGDGDVVDALIALGYSHKDARDALGDIAADITDTNARITAALRMLGK